MSNLTGTYVLDPAHSLIGFTVRHAMVTKVRGEFTDYDASLTIAENPFESTATGDLEAITGFDGREAGLEEIYVQRWFGGIPRYDETHLATVQDVLAKLPEDVAVVGGVGVPAVIAQARVAAQQLR